jgi:hypothetical protein
VLHVQPEQKLEILIHKTSLICQSIDNSTNGAWMQPFSPFLLVFLSDLLQRAVALSLLSNRKISTYFVALYLSGEFES